MVYDDTGLEEFTEYAYRVRAVNRHGATLSPEVRYRTPYGTPSDDVIMEITDITSHGATFGWTSPSEINGFISRYNLVSTNLTHPDEEQLWYEVRSIDVVNVIEFLGTHLNYFIVISQLLLLYACIFNGNNESYNVVHERD